MASELFGAPVGFRLAEQDQQQALLNNLKALELQAEIQGLPVRHRLQTAQARELEARTALSEAELAAAQRVQGALAGGGVPAADSGAGGAWSPYGQVQTLSRLADVHLGAGSVTKGRELANAASLLYSRAVAGDLAGVRQVAAEFKLANDRLDRAASILNNVRDQAGWDSAIEQLRDVSPEMADQLAGSQFDPGTVEQLVRGTMSVKDQLATAQRERSLRAQESRTGAYTGYLSWLRNFRERMGALAELAEKRRGKDAGRAVASPSQSDIDTASLLIRQRVSRGTTTIAMSAEDLGIAAATVASRARTLRQRNPALDPQVALEQALQQSIDAGDFSTTGSILGLGGRQRFAVGGRTPNDPLPKPPHGRFTNERWYVNPRGEVNLYWNGKFYTPSEVRGLNIPGAVTGGGEEEEDRVMQELLSEE